MTYFSSYDPEQHSRSFTEDIGRILGNANADISRLSNLMTREVRHEKKFNYSILEIS